MAIVIPMLKTVAQRSVSDEMKPLPEISAGSCHSAFWIKNICSFSSPPMVVPRHWLSATSTTSNSTFLAL
jgi:hypothetical protein